VLFLSSQRLTVNLNDRVFPDSRGNFFPALQKLCHTSPPSAGIFLWHQEDTGMQTPRCRYRIGVMKIKSRHNCSGFWSWTHARNTEKRSPSPPECGKSGSWIPNSGSCFSWSKGKKKVCPEVFACSLFSHLLCRLLCFLFYYFVPIVSQKAAFIISSPPCPL